VGGFEFEERRDAVPAKPPEDALPEAENPAVPPAEDEADGDKGVAEVFGDEVHAEDVEAERDDQQQHDREHRDTRRTGFAAEKMGVELIHVDSLLWTPRD
jgi:hypothetical protein